MIDGVIKELVDYGFEKKLINQEDVIYARNQILDIMQLSVYKDVTIEKRHSLEEILKELLDSAVERDLIDDNVSARDLFDTKLMNCLMPRPSEVVKNFRNIYTKSPEAATDYYYQLSQDSDYIRRYRICKDIKWITETKYGNLDITINLSKPEKDPKAIAAAANAKQGGYPKCLLCKENVGYAGRIDHPARNNHRIIPITINKSDWFMQYSPYVYYNEHCIVFNGEHTPMKIDKAAFIKLFDFVKQFPHYILGSNADLPIVGGSILSHDHFQGGRYEFAMAKAAIEIPFSFDGYENVEAGIVRWPMSVIRLRSKTTKEIIELASIILEKWRTYTDKAAFIYAVTDGKEHNTITPIARKNRDMFELDLVLRNNITTSQRPDGLYHPRADLHHIKKENIGLIEVMGLAILPSRLKNELSLVEKALLDGTDITNDASISKHAIWMEDIRMRYNNFTAHNVDDIVKKEVGIVFMKVLEDAGVYKCTQQGRKYFLDFLKTC